MLISFYEADMNYTVLALSLVAGVVGTGLGGVIGAMLKRGGGRTMGRVLSFAGGVMAGVVAFEMIPEAIAASTGVGKIGGIFLSVATTVGGMIAIYLINRLLDVIEKRRQKRIRVFAGIDTVGANPRATTSKDGRHAMLKAGIIMLIAIALHNFPEGMAIGASGAIGTDTGVLIAIIIAVHNVPEGMAISAPLVSGGMGGVKAVALTALAGGATVLGALVGLAVGGLGEIATGICLSLASGAMLYVTFCEILPQAITMNDGEVPSVSMLVGLICSIIFVFVL